MYATLSTMQSIEYRQLFRWYVDLSQLFSAIKISVISKDTFAFLCESVGLPEKDIESTTASLKGVQVEVAGIATVKGTKEFTFLDSVDGGVLKTLLAWQEMANNTGKPAYAENVDTKGVKGYTAGLPHGLASGTPTGYKIDIPAVMLDSQKNEKLRCIFVGAWAKTVTAGGDLSSDSSELAKPVVTISYDNAFYV